MRKLWLFVSIAIITVAMGACKEESKTANAQKTTPEQITAPSEQTVAQEQAAVVEEQTPVEKVTATVEKPSKEQQAPSAAPEAVVEQPDQDAVVVTVNGQKITEAEVDSELQKAVEMMKKRMPPGNEIPKEQLQQMRERIVDMKVEQALLSQEAKKHNVTVSDEQVLDEIKKIAGQRGQTIEDVKNQIAKMGLTLEDIMAQIRIQMQRKALMEALNPDAVVTDEEAQKFYDENPQQFQMPEQVRASHILIKFPPNATDEQKAKAKEKIEGILKRARAGEDFAALAKEYSEDPGSKDNGGEYTFPRGKMVKPFEDAAFSLKVGQISDPIETQYGYHIIKLSEKIPAKTVSFEEAKEQIKNYLEQQKERGFWTEYSKKMHDDATIVYSKKEQALRDEVKKAAEAARAARAAQMQKMPPPSSRPAPPAPSQKPETTK